MASLAPETIYVFRGFNVTNTLLATIFTDAVIFSLVFVVYKKISLIPGKLQNIYESVIEYFYDLTEQISGDRVKSIFPWCASFFFFIFFSNILGLLPGFSSVGFFHEGEHGKREIIPLLRAATSDFNTTLALATISLVATHTLSIKYIGIKNYIKRFFSLNPILLFVGALELISEFTKLFSLSFRLFGNIYAGEVVLATISSMFAFLAPIPFLLLESIVALVQALVFAMLTMVFMAIITTKHAEEH